MDFSMEKELLSIDKYISSNSSANEFCSNLRPFLDVADAGAAATNESQKKN